MTVDTRPTISPKSRFSDYEASAHEHLPYWARSTNPIVRRHLGLYWRTVPPEFRPFWMIYLVWVILMTLGMIFPPLFGFTMISFLAAVMIVPLALIYYGYILLNISIECAKAMQQEMTNNTFQLLRATPMTLTQIFLGKASAAMWRRMDDIVMLAQIAMAFSPPILFMLYSNTLFAPLLTLATTVVVAVRILLEPLMVGVIAVFVGLVIEGRARAITSAVAMSLFYFIILNLAANLPVVRGYTTPDGVEVGMNVPLLFLVDGVLPILLPVIIIYTLVKLSAYIVSD